MDILSFFIGMFVGSAGATFTLLLFIGNKIRTRKEKLNISRSYE